MTCLAALGIKEGYRGAPALVYASSDRGQRAALAVSAAQATAKRIIQEHEILLLSARDREVFVNALLNPAAPNEKLRRAARRYQQKHG